MRKEVDTLGFLMLPDNVYYGVQTKRALDNFHVSDQTTNDLPEMIRNLALIKMAAALANNSIGHLPDKICNAIVKAAEEAANLCFADQFPVDVFQGGGGTSFNMNMNEVLANRANEIITGSKGYERVHPNTHVNMGQSTNDVIPSVMKITCYKEIERADKSLELLEKAFADKAKQFKNEVKLSRTCLQDALPITFGQEFSAYRDFLKRNRAYLNSFREECLQLPLGGTAVGTGLGTYPKYLENVYRELGKIYDLNLTPEENFFDGMSNADFYVRLSGQLKSIATGLSKIATDLRIYSSGPRGGFCEIYLPAVQPGSSIMPGKINPVIPEMINQIGYQVCGNDFAITMATEGGEMDLNVWEMVISRNLFESFKLITRSAHIFATRCISGITVNSNKCLEDVEKSTALSCVIASISGYSAGSEVAAKASEEGISVKEAALKLNVMNKQQAEKLLNPLTLTDMQKTAEMISQKKLDS